MNRCPLYKAGDGVHDSWWPWRFGRVVKVLKTRVHVLWSDGEKWIYDSSHLKWLRVEE